MRKILLLLFLQLTLFACSNAQSNNLSAKNILNNAFKQAKSKHKNVLVIFHASWCGWCKKLDASINSPGCKKYFNNQYVVVHIIVHEKEKEQNNEGANELLEKYEATEAGLPFWLVINANGKLIADSFIKNADGTKSNIGCPATEKEVDAFIAILKNTSTISEKEIAAVKKEFRQNEIRK